MEDTNAMMRMMVGILGKIKIDLALVNNSIAFYFSLSIIKLSKKSLFIFILFYPQFQILN